MALILFGIQQIFGNVLYSFINHIWESSQLGNVKTSWLISTAVLLKNGFGHAGTGMGLSNQFYLFTCSLNNSKNMFGLCFCCHVMNVSFFITRIVLD